MNEYNNFLDKKIIIHPDSGFSIDKKLLNSNLFDFQSRIVEWSLIKGKSAVFADTGLGKTPVQLDWAYQIYNQIKKPILIFAPLAVSKQTKREGEKFGIKVNICENNNDIIKGINITNYEKLHKFSNANLGGIVIDESSILKGFDGKFRKTITEFSQIIPYRLACTATPAPNDLMEIINHAEFLGIMKQKEITGLFFIQDGNVTHKWRLKHHAKKDFYKWLASWAVALKKPSDLGFKDDGFILPKLNQKQIIVKSTKNTLKKNTLFSLEAKGLKERQIARRDSTEDRIEACLDLIKDSNEQWLIWCDLNKESNLLTRKIKDSVSFEKLYQATRRCWRFGQEKEVNSYIITSDLEGDVIKNIKRKEKDVIDMMNNLIKNMNLSGQLITKREEMEYKSDKLIQKPIFL